MHAQCARVGLYVMVDYRALGRISKPINPRNNWHYLSSAFVMIALIPQHHTATAP